jgi:hypothetical protein
MNEFRSTFGVLEATEIDSNDLSLFRKMRHLLKPYERVAAPAVDENYGIPYTIYFIV